MGDRVGMSDVAVDAAVLGVSVDVSMLGEAVDAAILGVAVDAAAAAGWLRLVADWDVVGVVVGSTDSPLTNPYV